MIPFVYLISIVIFIGGLFPWLSLVDFIRQSTGSDILAQSILLLWFGLLLAPFIFHHYAEIRADKKKALGIEEPIHKTSHIVFYVIGGAVMLVLLPMLMLIVIPTIYYLFGGHFE